MRRGALYFKLRAIGTVLKRDGAAGLARAVALRLSPAARRERRRKAADAQGFDSAGFDTGGIAFLSGLSIAEGDILDANPYDATPSYDFEAALTMLGEGVTGRTFVDLGSGKGRILLLAARHPFARIIGVEFAEELQAVAAANLARHAALHGPDSRILLHTGDAAKFAFPDEPLVVFLFNPFGAATIRKVADALHASWQAHPRPIHILYMNPQHGPEWQAAGFRRIGYAPDNRFAHYAPS